MNNTPKPFPQLYIPGDEPLIASGVQTHSSESHLGLSTPIDKDSINHIESHGKTDVVDNKIQESAELPSFELAEEDLETLDLLSQNPTFSLYKEETSEDMKKQIDVLYAGAQTCANQKEYSNAINLYKLILSQNDSSAQAMVAMGHCYTMSNDLSTALGMYKQAISIGKETPKDDRIWYGIGVLYEKIEDFRNAEQAFKSALKINKSGTLRSEILYHLGYLMKRKGNSKEAAQMLTQAVLKGTFPVEKVVEMLLIVGGCMQELQQDNDALQAYKYVLVLDDKNVKAMKSISWFYLLKGKPSDALEHIKKARTLDETDASISYIEARCYLNLQKHNESYESLTRCINIEPKNSSYWCSMGILFAELSQFKQSYECLTNAVKFDANVAENYFNLGCLFESNSQPNEALKMYEKASELKPHFKLAHDRKNFVSENLKHNKTEKLQIQFKHHPFKLAAEQKVEKVEKPKEVPKPQMTATAAPTVPAVQQKINPISSNTTNIVAPTSTSTAFNTPQPKPLSGNQTVHSTMNLQHQDLSVQSPLFKANPQPIHTMARELPQNKPNTMQSPQMTSQIQPMQTDLLQQLATQQLANQQLANQQLPEYNNLLMSRQLELSNGLFKPNYLPQQFAIQNSGNYMNIMQSVPTRLPHQNINPNFGDSLGEMKLIGNMNLNSQKLLGSIDTSALNNNLNVGRFEINNTQDYLRMMNLSSFNPTLQNISNPNIKITHKLPTNEETFRTNKKVKGDYPNL